MSELYTPRNDGIRLRAFSIQMLEVILLKIHSNERYVYLECVIPVLANFYLEQSKEVSIKVQSRPSPLHVKKSYQDK